uniref:Non-green plastid inner envelope membrane protein n=2 Tax=Aegilops tauschii subsp. strangulata TaxID=200361 RepID=A0A453FTK1_AEGTS
SPRKKRMDDMSPRISVSLQHPAACLRKPKRKKKRISSKIPAAVKHHANATEPSTTARELPSPTDSPKQKPRRNPTKLLQSILRSHFLRAVRLRRLVYPSPPSPPPEDRSRGAPRPSPMAASLLHAAASSPLAGPSPAARAAFRPLASSPFLRLARSSPDRRARLDAPLRALSGGARLAAPRSRRFVAALAGEEPMSSELGDDKEKETEKIEIEPEEAQEVWREMLKQFKAEAIRMQALTTQAYDVYSKRAREVLLEASEKLRIQADKAQKDLTIIAAEVGEEGQEYLQLAAKNSPDSIKDITETINAVGNLNGPSDYKDYHVGISFGTFLTVGGFLNFMLTGSTSAIRFGFVLGFALLALGISSLRSQRAGGRQPRLLLKGQAAIASVIFFKDLSVFFRYGWFPNVFAVLLSGMVATFYIHRIVTGGHNGRTESSSDN